MLRATPDQLLPLLKGAPAEAKSPVFILKGAGVKEVRAAVFPDGEGAVPMIGFLGNPAEIKELLGEDGPLAGMLESKGGGVYEFPMDGDEEGDGKSPLKFKVTERPDGMWISLEDTPMDWADIVQKRASQLTTGKSYAGELSFLPPKNKALPWLNPTLDKLGLTGFAAMGVGITMERTLEPLVDHLEGAERVSLGVLAAGDARLVDMNLDMEDAVRVTELAAYINGDKPGVGQYKKLAALLAHPELRGRAVPKGDSLITRLVWKQTSDETLIPLFQRAMNKVMSDPLVASTTEVFTQTNDELPLTVPYDNAAKKAHLEEAFGLENMLLTATSSETRASVRLHPDIGDNAMLMSSIMVEYKSVVNAAGEDLREIKERPSRGRINQNRQSSLSVRFDKAKKGPATKMEVEISMKLPGSVHLAEFKASDPPGTTRMAGDVPVTIERMENDVISVYAETEKEEFFLYVQVYDAMGRMLAQNNGGWGPKGRECSYFGKAATVKAYAVADSEKLVFHRTIPILPPDQKNTPARPAYELVPFYPLDQVTKADLDKTTIRHLYRNAHDLQVNCPATIAESDWTVHSFGRNAAAKLGSSYPEETEYTAFEDRDAEPGSVRVIFGSVDISAYVDLADVELSADKPEATLPGGGTVKAGFYDTYVNLIFGGGNWQVLNAAAFDANGRRLKSGENFRPVGGKAASVKFQASKTVEKKTVEFEFPLGEFDAAALKAYKASL